MVSNVRALSRLPGQDHGEEVLVYNENDEMVSATSSLLLWKPLEDAAAGEVYTSRHMLACLLLASADISVPRTGTGMLASTCDLELSLLAFHCKLEDIDRLSARLGSSFSRAGAGSNAESPKDFTAWVTFLVTLELEALEPPLTRNCFQVSDAPAATHRPQIQTGTPRTVRRTRAQVAATGAAEEDVNTASPAALVAARGVESAESLPADLQFLKLFDSSDFTSTQGDDRTHPYTSPLVLLAQLLWWLGDTSQHAQADPRSQLRVHAALLAPRLATFMGLSVSPESQPALAAGLADFWRVIQLPRLLSCMTAKVADMRSEFSDGVLYNTGTPEDQRRVSEKRFSLAMQKLLSEAGETDFGLCRQLFGDCELQTQVRCVRRLCDLFMPQRKTEHLHLHLPELERRLRDRQDALEAALSSGVRL